MNSRSSCTRLLMREIVRNKPCLALSLFLVSSIFQVSSETLSSQLAFISLVILISLASLSWRSLSVGEFSNPHRFSSPFLPVPKKQFSFHLLKFSRLCPYYFRRKHPMIILKCQDFQSQQCILLTGAKVGLDGTAKFIRQTLGLICPFSALSRPCALKSRKKLMPFPLNNLFTVTQTAMVSSL